MKEIYWVALTLVRGVGSVRIKALIEIFRSPENVFRAEFKELKECLPEPCIEEIKNGDVLERAQVIVEECARKGIDILTIDSPEYPEVLRHIPDPPPVLYLRGKLPRGTFIAVVGTRTPTSYGKVVTEKISEVIAVNGGVVVSGMAYGIDAIAHSASLKCGGETVAVLGSGVDVIYPSEHTSLYWKIVECGAVISEYPPGELPNQGYFPKRNRIISGLSKAVIVVEAGERSGAIITARCALEQGRDVYAVPGPITSSKSAGTNSLIKEGANPITKVEDVLEIMGYTLPSSEKYMDVSEDERRVLELLNDNEMPIDDIIERSGFEIKEVYSILTSLEIKGFVRRTERGYLKL